jgi:hypothetical protein
MPTIITGPTALTTGTQTDNVFANSQFEFMPYPARVEIGINGSAAGLIADFYAGGDVMGESLAVNAQNRSPLYPDDIVFVENVAAGTRMKGRVRNPTGGTLSHFFLARITPLV